MTTVTLSAAARRQLVLTDLGGGEGTTLTMAVRLEGPVNIPALEFAFGGVVARHGALRTVVDRVPGSTHGRLVASAELAMRVVDLSLLGVPAVDRELRRLLGEHVKRPFDRTVPPALRVDAAILGRELCVAVIAADHLAVDGWSLGVLAREVAEIYRATVAGRPAVLAPVPPVHLREIPDVEHLGDDGRRWIEKVSAPSDDSVPGAHRRGSEPGGPAAVHSVVLPPRLSTALDDACRREGGTLYMAVLAAWVAVLHRLDGRGATTVVTLTSGRSQTQLEQVIAHLGNVLPIRVEIPSGVSVGRLWRLVREACAGSLGHQDVPYELVARERRRAGAEGVPGVLCAGLAPAPELALPGVQATPVHAPPGTARFDLTIEVGRHRSGVQIALQYDRRAIPEDSARMLGRHLRAAVRHLCEQPTARCDQLDLEKPAPAPSACAVPDPSTLHGLFEQQAHRTPDAVALAHDGAHLSYRALNRRANRVARGLLAAGVCPEDRVVVELGRGIDAVTIQLAVMKTGAAWVPLDPDDPAERRHRLTTAVAARCVVVDHETSPPPDRDARSVPTFRVDELDRDAHPAGDLGLTVHPLQAAYLMFTSGSTGEPKAVVGIHASTVTRLRWMWAAHPFRPDDRSCIRSAPVFVDAVAELYGPLLAGVPVDVIGADTARDADRLLRLLRRTGSTRLLVVPVLLAELLRRLPAGRPFLPALRLCVTSGERLPQVTADRFAQLVGATLLNLYGSTEVSGDATAAEVVSGMSPGIGAAIAGAWATVRGPSGEVVPALGTGELHVGGTVLARGYHGDPVRTAIRFVPDLDGPAGGRAFRTADLVRSDPGGLVFVGRLDAQLKVRGVRVEPGEVEAAFLDRVDVAEVAVCARWQQESVVGLVAHVVPAAGADVEHLAAALRIHAARVLPGALVPVVRIADGPLPVTPTGKVDRRALESVAAVVGEPAPPSGPVEKAVAAAFDAVLPDPCRSADDDFFALGGHSLIAAELLARIEQDLEVRLTLRELFEARTVRGVAAAVLGHPRVEAGPGPSPVVPSPDAWYLPFPLTEVQQAYWVGRDSALPLGGVATHGYLEIDVAELDVRRLEQAVNALVERHPALRTVVLPAGEQQVLADVPRYRIATTTVGDDDWPDALASVRNEMSHQVLAADTWPLFDIRVTRRPDGAAHLHVGLDALIADAHSAALLTEELAVRYRRPGLRFAPLGITFRDVVVSRPEVGPEAREHWRRRALDLPDAPELPVLGGENGSTPVFRRRTATVGTTTWRVLQDSAKAFGVTPTALLLAAYAEVLRRWSRSERFTLVLTLFHRPDSHPDIRRVVGDFTALVPLDVSRTGRPTFAGYARALQVRLGEELDHDPAGGVAVLRERGGATGAGRGFPVVFTSTLGLPAVADEVARPEPLGRLVHGVSQTPQAHLDHQVGEGPDGLVLNWDAVEDLFPAGMLDAMRADYLGALTRLAEDDGAWSSPVETLFPGLPADDVPGSVSDAAADNGTLPGIVRAAALRGPDRIALTAGGVQMTYRELLSRADRTGRRLVASGIRRGDLVGVAAMKGWPQIVAVLAVTGAGAAYVPLDPDLPEARLQLLFDRTGARHVVVDRRGADRLAPLPAVRRGKVTIHDIETAPGADPAPGAGAAPPSGPPSGHDLAYVIFTSGSTGQPKGVTVDHDAAVNTILDINRRFGLHDRDRVLGLSSLSFDLSVWDVFGTLAAGGCLVLPDPDRAHDPAHWLRTARDGGATVWNSVPALLGLAVDRAELVEAVGLEGLRLALLSGDWIPVDLPHRVRDLFPGCSVIGLGGATEASIWSIHHRTEVVPRDGSEWTSVPYGRPLSRQWLTVLDSDSRIRPDWVPGGLVIGGSGLAVGYWREPALTASKFVPWRGSGPDGARAYRTGDVARFRPGGVIEFLGRDDGQVKINGFRVELGEIDAALLAVDGVTRAATAVLGPDRGDRRLAAAVVASGEAVLSPETVRRSLESVLPAHQVPRRIVVVDALPLTANGKVDRRTLVELLDGWSGDPTGSTVTPLPPEAPQELVNRLCHMWAEVLGVGEVRPDDNFFALGGTSLVAVRLLAVLVDALQVRLPMTTLFEEPTVARLAGAVVQAQEARPRPVDEPVAPWTPAPQNRYAPFPLTEVQQAYWIGRRPGWELGGVATHSYVELDIAELDVDRLDAALGTLVDRHDALRTVFRDDGLQEVVPDVGPYRATRAPDGPVASGALRARMSHQVRDPARWPLFEVAVSSPHPSSVRLHVSVDLLIADAWSFRVLQRELLALYHGLALEPRPDCTFRDYVLASRTARDGADHARARDYWARRVGDLPGPPPLPKLETRDGGARFQRLSSRWDEDAWRRLRRAAAARSLTPSGVLCAALGEVIAMWAQTPTFLLNLTTFNRMPLHPDVEGVVGDFTSTTVLAVDASAPSFSARAERLQAQIFRDLEHRSFSGIDVLRLLRRDPRRRAEVQAPVVFTSLLVPERTSASGEQPHAWDATVAYAVSQTPQVRLDVQVSEHDGDLFITWDYLDEAFPPGVVRAMFDGYSRVIDALAGVSDPGLDYWEAGPAWTS